MEPLLTKRVRFPVEWSLVALRKQLGDVQTLASLLRRARLRDRAKVRAAVCDLGDVRLFSINAAHTDMVSFKQMEVTK